MKVLAVVGSRRKEGNTAFLVRETLRPLREKGASVRLVFLEDYTVEGCTGCERCGETFRCVIDDGMQALLPYIVDADALVLGSPVHFYSTSSGMQAFIERCYCLEVFAGGDRFPHRVQARIDGRPDR